MTEYGHHAINRYRPDPLYSQDAVKEKKEARRKILEAIWQRRRENNRRFYKKLQAQTSTLS
jgi:hypothetical protein